MSTYIRYLFAILIGFIVGSIVNISLVTIGPIVIPPPEGVDMSTMETLAETIHLMGPLNFLAPFLAHALGTLTGVLTTCLIANNNRMILGYGMGAFFLVGGIAASIMIPAPAWFIATDLLFAYLPMAWLAIKLADLVRPATKP